MKKLLLLSLVLASVGLQAVKKTVDMPDHTETSRTWLPLHKEPRFDSAAAYEELEGEYKYLERRVYRLEAHMNRIADAWMEEKKVAPEPERPVMELRRK